MSDLEIYRLIKENTSIIIGLLKDRVENDVNTELHNKDIALGSCLQWIFLDGCKKWISDLWEQGCFGDEEFNIVKWSSQCDWDEVEMTLQDIYKKDWEHIQASG